MFTVLALQQEASLPHLGKTCIFRLSQNWSKKGYWPLHQYNSPSYLEKLVSGGPAKIMPPCYCDCDNCLATRRLAELLGTLASVGQAKLSSTLWPNMFFIFSRLEHIFNV